MRILVAHYYVYIMWIQLLEMIFVSQQCIHLYLFPLIQMNTDTLGI